MASKREDVILALGLDPGTFQQDLAQAVANMKGFSGAVATGHQTAAGAAGTDDRAHAGLLGRFREFRTEQVQQGRMARFYASELMGIVPASDAVKGKLQELIGIGIEGAAGGFGFGLGLEVAKFAIGSFIEFIQHAKKEEEELAKATAAMVIRIGDETAKLRGSRMGEQEDDVTRRKLEGANSLLKKRNDLQWEYDNLAGQERIEAYGNLNILNEEVKVWELKNGKLENFVNSSKALLAEQEQARAIRNSETTNQLQAQARTLAAGTEQQKIQAEWANAIADATNRNGLGLLTGLNLELAINNAYEQRRLRIQQLQTAAENARRASNTMENFTSAFELPTDEDAKDAARRAAAAWTAEAKHAHNELAPALPFSMDAWSASGELPQDEDSRNAALRAAAARERATRALGEHQDLFQGTEEYRNKQLDSIQALYGSIDEMRQQDLIKEDTAQQMKAQLAVRENELQLQHQQAFFATLATMQSSSIREIAAIGKAAAIAQATIDGILGVQKALATFPPPFSFAMAAAVGAAAAANVAQIASTFEVGGWTGGIAGRPAGTVHGEEFVVRAGPAARNRSVLEAMNAGASLSASAVQVVPKVIIENHGTPQVYSDPQLTPEGVRLIARDEVHREAPRAVASELQRDPNGHVSRALQKTTNTERRRI